MKHNMRLNNEPYELIKKGTKTIELRLNDEKRKLIKKNDIIYFENRITKEVLKTKVIKLHKYNSFEELYKDFDKKALGYLENEKAFPEDMEQYYSKEEQKKYGVLGIEIKLLNTLKKEIINNYDHLSINDVNNVVRRAKLIVITPDDKIAICHSSGNYHFLGGHVESDESDLECLKREIKEEAGIDLPLKEMDPILTIKYINKDYPEKGVNTFTMAHYYAIEYDFKPDKSKITLTKEEKNGGFEIEFINKNKIIKILEDSLNESTRKGVTLDTILALKEYLN